MSEKKVETRSLPEIRDELEQYGSDYMAALKDGDLRKMTAAEENMKQAKVDYAAHKRDLVFAELRGMAKPVLEAVKMFDYEVISYKFEREDGKVTGVQIVDQRKQIDLKDLCKFLNVSTVWEYKVEKLLQLFAYRTAVELGYSKTQLKDFVAGWALSEYAKQEDLGKEPVSNTNLVKTLKAVIEAILPGENLQPNNYDASFVLKSFSRKSKKEKWTIEIAKPRDLTNVIHEVMNRIVLGGEYAVKPPKLKGGVSTAKKGEEKKEEKSADHARPEKKGGKKSGKKAEVAAPATETATEAQTE